MAATLKRPLRAARPNGAAGRTVYIGLRSWLKKDGTLAGKAVNCTGLSLRAVDFTPQEVHDIILKALTIEAGRAQLIARGRKAMA